MSSRASALRLEILGLVALAFVLGCDREVSEPLATAALDQEAVVHAGCREIWLESRPRCLFEPEAPLRLWVGRPDASRVSVRVDGEPLATIVDDSDAEGGTRLAVPLPAGSERLEVELTEPPATWSLPLREWSVDVAPPVGVSSSRTVDAGLERSFNASLEGRHLEALEELDGVARLAARYPEGQAELATYRGIAYWRQGRLHDAATWLAEGVLFAMRTHDPELIRDAIPLYVAALTELGYWDAAAERSEHVLGLMQSEAELFPCLERSKNNSTLGYAHLLFARHHGLSSARARSLLEEALSGMVPDGECPDSSSVPAVVLSLADDALDRGEPAEALAIVERVDIPTAITADERMRLRDAKLRAMQALEHPSAELEQELARLAQEVDAAGLPEGRWRLALRRGDLLAHQGRIDEAIASYDEAEGEAHAIATLAAVGVGREAVVALHAQSTERLVGLLARQGRPEDALCAAREAQARRIQGVGGATLPEERRQLLDAAIEQYQASQRELDEGVAEEPLLPRGELEARRLELVRKEQALAKLANQILREQSTWRPSCDDLVPPREGELLLGLYPASDGWFVFAQDEHDTEVHWLAGGPTHALDDSALGSELLEPLSERLAVAKRVRVLASGRAQDIDVHVLTWRGAPLIEHVVVTYGAELPLRVSPRAADAEPSALLVADPTESLPKAYEEIETAAAWMTAQGWAHQVLDVDDADRERVRKALLDVSFFYFAGHGVHGSGPAPEVRLPPYAGGSEEWPAHLMLKNGAKLEIQDVLMLVAGPRHVALLGCETGVPGGDGGGMSLALAFLVAGAEEVVATPETTTEATAKATGLGLLRAMSEGGVDLGAGLRAAQREMLRRGEDVGRYRVWVR